MTITTISNNTLYEKKYTTYPAHFVGSNDGILQQRP